MKPLRVGSLFSGIGGLELGFERAGMRTVFQVEIDDYARRVLAKHWPHVPRFSDVRDVGAHNLPECDVLCGGFPCQDISSAGGKSGIEDGSRSGLWREFARLIRELRPRYVVVENVSALLGRGMGRVLGDLAAVGYDAEWDCLPAAAFGAPHLRDRAFIVAYPQGIGRREVIRPPQGASGHATLCGCPYGGPACEVHWPYEPGLARVVYGVPNRVDQIRGLGNSVVPAVAAFVGKCVVGHAKEEAA